jgi:hypothetical protein
MKGAAVPVALFVLLAFLSCTKEPDRKMPLSVVADAKSAFAIVDGLPFWSLLSSGTLVSRESLPIGEKVSLLGQTAKYTLAGKERDYAQAKRESGSTGWVRADFVVSRAILAVVTTDNAVIYSVPNNTAATTETIALLTIVAVHADTGGMRFIRVTCYDEGAKALLRGVYLRNEGVSSNPDDVQGAILLKLAAASKSSRQKKAFLTSAIKDHPASLFLPQLTAALEELNGPPLQPSPAPAPAAGASADSAPATPQQATTQSN